MNDVLLTGGYHSWRWYEITNEMGGKIIRSGTSTSDTAGYIKEWVQETASFNMTVCIASNKFICSQPSVLKFNFNDCITSFFLRLLTSPLLLSLERQTRRDR